MNSLYYWYLATRPNTLSASIAPILIGTSIAYADKNIHLYSALFTLIAAITIQIATNFSNDYYDFVRGADDKDRIGPKRATQSGWIKPKTMLNASIFAFSLSFRLRIYKEFTGRLPI
mgnify:FL=1